MSVRLRGELREVATGSVVANAWNPNEQSDEERSALARSLAVHGQVLPLVVRRLADGAGYELLDGEHRLDAMREHGSERVQVLDLGEVPDDEAMHVNAALTTTRGEADAGKMRALLYELRDRFEWDAERIEDGLAHVGQYELREEAWEEPEEAAWSESPDMTLKFTLPKAEGEWVQGVLAKFAGDTPGARLAAAVKAAEGVVG